MKKETPFVETDLESIACPLCGSDNSVFVIEAYDRRKVSATPFQLVRCTGCSLVYQNPRVRPQSIGKYYAGNYYEQLRGQANLAREQRKRRIVEEFGFRPGTLLDVGCASGDFLVEMRDHGWSVEGVEFSPEPAAFCRQERGLKVATGELHARPEDGLRFDLITMWAVLPHLPDPLSVVGRAVSLLRQGGALLLCVANIESWAFSIRKSDWGHLDQPRHYCMYTPATVDRLFRECGLEPGVTLHDERVERSQIIVPPLGLARRVAFRVLHGRARALASKLIALANRPLARPLEAMAQWRQRGGVIVGYGIRK